jgi:hypothetical protein
MSFASFGIPLVLLAALLACKSSGSSSSSPSASGASGSAEPEDPIGKITELTSGQVEARAKKAGYTQKSSDEDKDDGMSIQSFEFESDDNFAYVTLVDLGTDSKKHASKVGDNGALVVQIEAEKQDAQKLLESLLEKHALGDIKKDTLKSDLAGMKWDVTSSSSDSEDGVTTVSLVADRQDDDVVVTFFDFKSAKGEGRLVVEGSRFLNVFVCEDCTKRKEGVLTDMANRRKARKLLAKITKS